MTQQASTRKTLCLGIVDSGGNAVPSACVTIEEASVPVPEIALLSDAEGKVMMRLPTGRYRFMVRGPVNTKATLELSLDEDNQSAIVNLAAE